MKRIFVFAYCFFIQQTIFAQLKVANVFTDHMVLQRNAAIPVWGWAGKGEKVTVNFHGQIKTTTADKSGKWFLNLDKEIAGGPYTLIVKTKKENLSLQDVLVGDVWICSGQSNMEWVLSATNDAATEISAASNNNIRHIKVEHEISIVPLADIKKTSWQVCTPETAPNFTAVGYYFAKNLQKELNVPIGLINTTWGGTIAETWISKTGLETSADYKNIAAQLPSDLTQFNKDQLDRIRSSVSKFQYTDLNEKVADWYKENYDDSHWSILTAPKQWEEQGLNGLDGIVWYRKTITLTAAQAGKDATLWLSKIDDCDTTFVNGVKIGSTCTYDKLRKYVVPGKLLKEGKNVIAVKILDTGGGGGIWGDASDVKMETASGIISLAGEWKARVDVNGSPVSVNPNSMPTLLYNAMVNPLLPFAIKGVIWYQGESNAEWAQQYAVTFPLLITDWRNKFKQGNFPFYFVQLASFNASDLNGTTGSKWAELRASQTQTLSLPNTGMAVTSDIGNAKDIHPRNKKDVGMRLALIALKNDYGKNVTVSGPMYKSMVVENSHIRIEFSNADGLTAANNKYGYLGGFMIAGKDQQFHWAKAWVRENSVIVWSDDVQDPVAVRYAWTDDIDEANLINKEGLPAVPFRTDNWKLLTDGIKYFIGK